MNSAYRRKPQDFFERLDKLETGWVQAIKRAEKLRLQLANAKQPTEELRLERKNSQKEAA